MVRDTAPPPPGMSRAAGRSTRGPADRPAVPPRARDSLVAAQLRIPHLRADRLARPDLVRRIEAAAERALLLVSAPPGFGKSTLLADWAGRSRRPVAWLSLDPEDNDPARFWRYVAAGIEQVRPGLESRVLPLLER